MTFQQYVESPAAPVVQYSRVAPNSTTMVESDESVDSEEVINEEREKGMEMDDDEIKSNAKFLDPVPLVKS